MDIIKFYMRRILPLRVRVEDAEAKLVHMSKLVNKLSHELAKHTNNEK